MTTTQAWGQQRMPAGSHLCPGTPSVQPGVRANRWGPARIPYTSDRASNLIQVYRGNRRLSSSILLRSSKDPAGCARTPQPRPAPPPNAPTPGYRNGGADLHEGKRGGLGCYCTT